MVIVSVFVSGENLINIERNVVGVASTSTSGIHLSLVEWKFDFIEKLWTSIVIFGHICVPLDSLLRFIFVLSAGQTAQVHLIPPTKLKG